MQWPAWILGVLGCGLLAACRAASPQDFDPCHDVASCRAIVASAPERYESRFAYGHVSGAVLGLTRTARGRQELLDLLRRAGPAARDRVADELIGDLVMSNLIRFLPQSPDAMDREAAIAALALAYQKGPSNGVRDALIASGDPRGIPAMAAGLESSDTSVSHDAYHALQRLGSVEATAALANAPARLRAWNGNFACPRRAPKAAGDKRGGGAPWSARLSPVAVGPQERMDVAGPCADALTGDALVHPRDDSCFVAEDHGEWGGWIEVEDMKLQTRAFLGRSNPMRFVDRGAELLVLSGICHGYCVGAVHTIRRGGDGQWSQLAVAWLPGEPRRYALDRTGRPVLELEVTPVDDCPTTTAQGQRITVVVERDGALTLLD